MDFVKKMVNAKKQGGAATGQQQQPAGATNPDGTPAQQNQDYGDKAAKFLADKYAPGKTTDKQREQMTDGVRGIWTKLTGKPVSSKISN